MKTVQLLIIAFAFLNSHGENLAGQFRRPRFREGGSEFGGPLGFLSSSLGSPGSSEGYSFPEKSKLGQLMPDVSAYKAGKQKIRRLFGKLPMRGKSPLEELLEERRKDKFKESSPVHKAELTESQRRMPMPEELKRNIEELKARRAREEKGVIEPLEEMIPEEIIGKRFELSSPSREDVQKGIMSIVEAARHKEMRERREKPPLPMKPHFVKPHSQELQEHLMGIMETERQKEIAEKLQMERPIGRTPPAPFPRKRFLTPAELRSGHPEEEEEEEEVAV